MPSMNRTLRAGAVVKLRAAEHRTPVLRRLRIGALRHVPQQTTKELLNWFGEVVVEGRRQALRSAYGDIQQTIATASGNANDFEH